MDIARVQSRRTNYFSRTEALTCQHVYWCSCVPKKNKKTEADQCLSQLNHWSGECHASCRGSLVSMSWSYVALCLFCVLWMCRVRHFFTACFKLSAAIGEDLCELTGVGSDCAPARFLICDREEAAFWRRLLLLHRPCVSSRFSVGHFGHVTEESITVSSMSLCALWSARRVRKIPQLMVAVSFQKNLNKTKKAKSLRKLRTTRQLWKAPTTFNLLNLKPWIYFKNMVHIFFSQRNVICYTYRGLI